LVSAVCSKSHRSKALLLGWIRAATPRTLGFPLAQHGGSAGARAAWAHPRRGTRTPLQPQAANFCFGKTYPLPADRHDPLAPVARARATGEYGPALTSLAWRFLGPSSRERGRGRAGNARQEGKKTPLLDHSLAKGGRSPARERSPSACSRASARPAGGRGSLAGFWEVLVPLCSGRGFLQKLGCGGLKMKLGRFGGTSISGTDFCSAGREGGRESPFFFAPRAGGGKGEKRGPAWARRGKADCGEASRSR